MAKSFLELLGDSLGPGISKIDAILAKEEKALPLPALLDTFVQRVMLSEILPDGLWGCTKCDWVGDRASAVHDHQAHAHHVKLSEEASLAGKQASMTLVVNKDGDKVPRCTKCGYTGKSPDEAASFYARHIRDCALKFRDTKATVCKIGGCGYATAGHDEFLEHIDEAHRESEFVKQISKPADVVTRLRKSGHLKDELAPLGEWFRSLGKPNEAWTKAFAEALAKDGRFAQVGDGWTLASKVPPPAPLADARATKKTIRTTKTARTAKTERTAALPISLADIDVRSIPDHGPGFLTWEREWRVSHYIIASALLVVDRYEREGSTGEQLLARLHGRYEQVEKITRYGVKETKNRVRIGTRFDIITDHDARGPCLHARPELNHLAAIAKVWPEKPDTLIGEVALLAQNCTNETHQNTGLSETHWEWLRIFATLPTAEGGWVEPHVWLEAINKLQAERGEEQLPNLGSTLVQHFLVPFGLLEVSKKKPATYRLTPFANMCLTQ